MCLRCNLRSFPTILIPMKIFHLFIYLFLALCIVDTFRSYLLFRKGVELAKEARAFEQQGSSMRILVLGDSTAFGTGVDDPKYSTAGRLGAKYPQAEIVNLAENGLRIEGLQEIVKNGIGDSSFDLILVQIGANDIIRMKSTKDIEIGIRNILEELKGKGEKIVVLHSGNIGEAKFFPFYVRGLLSKRSREVTDIYTRVAKETNLEYVNLFEASIAPLLKTDPDKYYASDYLHLSNEGYGLWFEEINKHL